MQNGVEDRELFEGIDYDEHQKLEHTNAALCLVLTALNSLRSIYLKCTVENAVQSDRYSGHNTNPAGDIGEIRSRSKRQKKQLWNQWNKLARDCFMLSAERASLVVDIAGLEMRLAGLLSEFS